MRSAVNGIHRRLLGVDSRLLAQDLVHCRAVPQIHPAPRRGPLLLVLAVANDHVVETLGAGYWGREPDLFVWWLLVDHVGADFGYADVHYAGL